MKKDRLLNELIKYRFALNCMNPDPLNRNICVLFITFMLIDLSFFFLSIYDNKNKLLIQPSIEKHKISKIEDIIFLRIKDLQESNLTIQLKTNKNVKYS